MSRLPFLRREDATLDGQRSFFDAVVGSRGRRRMINDQGGLTGPFNAWMRVPAIGSRLADVGAMLRSESELDDKLYELVIATVAAYWRGEYAWWAHSQLAVERGVDESVVDALRRGDRPEFANPDEEVVFEVVGLVLAGGRIDDPTYEAAVARLGETGLIKLVAMTGFYSLLSMTLNVFDVPLPRGVNRTWPEVERTR